MPGTDPFLNYVEDTRERLDLKKALDNRKSEIDTSMLKLRKPLDGTPLENPEIPEPPPAASSEGDFGANVATRKYWNPNGGISDAPTLGPAISTLGKGALEATPSHVVAKYTMSGKRVDATEETSFLDAAKKGIESIPGLAKQSLGGLLQFTGDVGIAGGGVEGAPGAGPEEGSLDPNWQAQVTGQEMYRRGEADVEKTLPDVEPGTLKAHVYGAVQSLGLSGVAMATGVLSGSTMPLIALAALSGTQEYGAQREGGSDVPTAVLGAVVNGLAEYWGERLPFEAYMKSPGFFVKAIKGALFDTVGELGTQAVQSAVQKLTYQPGMTWDDFGVAMKDTFIQSLMAGGAQGIVVGGAAHLTQRTDIGATNFRQYVEQNFEGATVNETAFGATVTLPSGRTVEIHTAASPLAGELHKQALDLGDPKSSEKIRSGKEVLSGVYFKSGSLVATENDLIFLTGQADLTTLSHEKGHLVVSVLQDVLSPEERAAIGLPEEGKVSIGVEEQVMDAFEDYAYKRTPSIENPMSPLDKAFQKVIDFAHEIYSAFAGPTERTMFEQMRTGKIFQREGAVRLPGESDAAFQVRTMTPKYHEPPPKTASGRVIGAPASHQSPQAKEGLIRKLVKWATDVHKVNPEQAQWYEKTGEKIRLAFGLQQDAQGNWTGNIEDADRFMRAIAAWSLRMPIDRNATSAVDVMHLLSSGKEPLVSGAVNSAENMADRFRAIAAADEVSSDLVGLGPKAASFYWDIHNATFGVRDAKNTTIDSHILQAMELKNSKGNPMEGTSLKDTQYAWARDVMEETTKRFNKLNGTDYDPRNVQALVWTWNREGKIATTETVDHMGKYIGAGIVTGEAIPATNSDVAPWIHGENYEAKKSASDHVINSTLFDDMGRDVILSRLMKPEGGNVFGMGTWEGAVNPNFQKSLLLSNTQDMDLVNLYSDLFGYIFTQNSVLGYIPDETLLNHPDHPNAIAIRRVGGEIPPSIVGSFYEKLREKIPGMELTYRGGEFHVINFMGLGSEEFKTKITEAAHEWAKEHDIETKAFHFGARSNFSNSDADGSAEWKGGLYVQRILAAGGPDLLRWADSLRQTALSAWQELSPREAVGGTRLQSKNYDSSRTTLLYDINGKDITPAVRAVAYGKAEPIRQVGASDRIWLLDNGKMLPVPYIHQSTVDDLIVASTNEPIGKKIWLQEFGGALQAIRFHGYQGNAWRLTGSHDASLNFEVFAPISDKQFDVLSRSIGARKSILVDVTSPEGAVLTYVSGKGPAALDTLMKTVEKAYSGKSDDPFDGRLTRGSMFQTKSVQTPAGEFPLNHDGWEYDGEMMGYHQYTNRDPGSPAFNATILTDKPENLQKKIDATVKKFSDPKFQTRTPGQKGLTVNFSDAEVNALGEELLRGAFEKLQFTQSNERSVQKAQELIKAGKMSLDTFLSHDPYTAWPDTAHQVAAEQIAGGVFDYVKGRIADWRDGKITADEANQARMVGMASIASWYLPQSEVGRMLQARQIAVTPEGLPVRDLMQEQMKFEKDLQELKNRGLVTDDQVLDAMSKFYSVDQAQSFVRRVAKAKVKEPSVLNQLFYFSLLSNPVTQAANIVGNIGPLFFATADQYLAEKIGSAPKGGTAGMMAGLYHSILEAFVLAGRAGYTGESTMGGDKFRNPRLTGIDSVDQARNWIQKTMDDKSDPYHDRTSPDHKQAVRDMMEAHRMAYNPISGDRMARLTSGNIDADGPLGRVLDVLGEFVDAPFKGLAAGDEFFKVINYRMWIWKSAYEMATEKGLSGKAFNDFVADYVDDPPSAADTLAHDFAKKQTFTSELGPIAEVFQSWNREYPLFRVIVPFVKVIGNIAKYNLEHTPFAYAFRQVRADISAGGVRRDMALSKMAVGSAMMLSFAGLAAAGLITGGGPSDPKLKKLWSQKDSNGNVAWQEYSMKIGGRWVSYKRIEPFATPIGVAADIVEILKFAPSVDIAEAMIGGAIAFTRNFTSKTYAQGISNFLEAITSGGGDTMQSNAARWGKQSLGMLVPGGVAQVARVADPTVRDTHEWLDTLKARVPGLSQTIEPARNLKGDVMTVGMYESIPGKGLGMVNPFMYAGTTDDVVTKEIIRNRVPLTMPSRRLGGGSAPGGAMFDEGSTAIDLTPEQYGWFVKMAGNGLKDPKTGRGMWDTLTAIVNGMEPVIPRRDGKPAIYYAQKNPDGTPVFSDGPEGGKAAIISKVVHLYRDKVRDMIEKGDVYPEVRNEYISKSIGKKINRAPQIGGAR